MTDESQLLNAAIDKFESEHSDEIISVSRVINPLLAIWKLANDIDHSVAIPIEQLLTALNGRTITTPVELTEAMDSTRLALAVLVAV